MMMMGIYYKNPGILLEAQGVEISLEITQVL